MVILQMSNAYFDKSIETEDIKYVVPEMTMFSLIIIISNITTSTSVNKNTNNVAINVVKEN